LYGNNLTFPSSLKAGNNIQIKVNNMQNTVVNNWINNKKIFLNKKYFLLNVLLAKKKSDILNIQLNKDDIYKE
jgi:hypothetical protein